MPALLLSQPVCWFTHSNVVLILYAGERAAHRRIAEYLIDEEVRLRPNPNPIPPILLECSMY